MNLGVSLRLIQYVETGLPFPFESDESKWETQSLLPFKFIECFQWMTKKVYQDTTLDIKVYFTSVSSSFGTSVDTTLGYIQFHIFPTHNRLCQLICTFPKRVYVP
ncbi:unnamed protein product [Lactuca virosa]|uniref:Uncharacterized protein n=1 Tax=Lactuca virosa TaxID=75947 RepID=A0AAU9P788_9ASTR|nr:unnamed protein product [Lactuca virosa]